MYRYRYMYIYIYPGSLKGILCHCFYVNPILFPYMVDHAGPRSTTLDHAHPPNHSLPVHHWITIG